MSFRRRRLGHVTPARELRRLERAIGGSKKGMLMIFQ